MSRNNNRHSKRWSKRKLQQRIGPTAGVRRRAKRPGAAYRRRASQTHRSEPFNAPEDWHEPAGRDDVRVIVQKPGDGYVHAVTADDVKDRIAELPKRFTEQLEVVQLSGMTRKRALFPCYGMQWATTVYLYPIEDSLVEVYDRPPHPEQVIEARMYGGRWEQEGHEWKLIWTPQTIRDFYLNNILIHEIGHTLDDRNTSYVDRERYANWFATEYGYRASRGRR
ncbi:MAG: hypothetical protein ACE5KM_06340 [Planctomycetaceae bacterium]